MESRVVQTASQRTDLQPMGKCRKSVVLESQEACFRFGFAANQPRDKVPAHVPSPFLSLLLQDQGQATAKAHGS